MKYIIDKNVLLEKEEREAFLKAPENRELLLKVSMNFGKKYE